jgi:hypothetical protein
MARSEKLRGHDARKLAETSTWMGWRSDWRYHGEAYRLPPVEVKTDASHGQEDQTTDQGDPSGGHYGGDVTSPSLCDRRRLRGGL